MKMPNQKRIEAVERALNNYETPTYIQNYWVKAPMLDALLKVTKKITGVEKDVLEKRINDLFLVILKK